VLGRMGVSRLGLLPKLDSRRVKMHYHKGLEAAVLFVTEEEEAVRMRTMVLSVEETAALYLPA
jgi:hypothetical protein